MRPIIFLATIVSVLTASNAAFAVGYVKKSGVEKGEVEVEYQFVRFGDSNASKDNKQKHEVELYYSPTDDLKLSVEAEAERAPQTSGLEAKAYGLSAQYELTSTNEDWWLGSALYGKYELADSDRDPDEGKIGVLLDKKYGRFTTIANLFLERELGDNRQTDAAFESALQTSYSISPYFQPGLEWHGEYGEVDQFHSTDNQEHYLGPIVKSEMLLGGTELEMELGYFRGITDASADHALRVLFEVEYFF